MKSFGSDRKMWFVLAAMALSLFTACRSTMPVAEADVRPPRTVDYLLLAPRGKIKSIDIPICWLPFPDLTIYLYPPYFRYSGHVVVQKGAKGDGGGDWCGNASDSYLECRARAFDRVSRSILSHLSVRRCKMPYLCSRRKETEKPLSENPRRRGSGCGVPPCPSIHGCSWHASLCRLVPANRSIRGRGRFPGRQETPSGFHCAGATTVPCLAAAGTRRVARPNTPP